MLKLRLFILLMMWWATPLYAQSTDIPKKLVNFVEETLVTFGTLPDLVEAVTAQNASNLSLSKIKEIDQEWKATPGMTRFMLDLMGNAGALALWNLQSKYLFLVESFIIDKQGALVAMTRKNDDYWQGDEDYFTQTLQTGTVQYGKIITHKSIDEVVVRITVPVKSGATTIGAIAFEINLDHWEKR